ncbi:MAG: caspase family protein [Henriciella sp.]|nr:caspase family protein [Henriciella sp.]
MIRSFLIIASLWVISASAVAQQRIALVIGNSAYETEGWSLANPVRDVRLVRIALEDVGFDVHTVTDATDDEMRAAFQQHGDRLAAAGDSAVGFVFFAGHGIQSQGLNYLIPVNASIFTEADVWRDAPRLEDLFMHLRRAGNQTNFVVLDACRNNGLLRSVRSAKGGLASTQKTRGTLVAFATQPGNVAEDGAGRRNSPYASALAAYLRKPGLSAESMFRGIATRVEIDTSNKQQPWIESGLRGEEDFCFAGCRAAMRAPSDEATDLQQALNSGSIAELSRFLETYPATSSRTIVDRELSRLRSLATPGDGRSLVEEPGRNGVPAPRVGESWQQYTGLVIPGCESSPDRDETLCQANKIGWSPDGSLLAAATTTGMVHILDPVTGEELHKWSAGFLEPATDLAWSPDSKHIALTSLWNNRLAVFNAKTGYEVVEARIMDEEGRGFTNALEWNLETGLIAVPYWDRLRLLEFDGEALNLVQDIAAPDVDVRGLSMLGSTIGLAGQTFFEEKPKLQTYRIAGEAGFTDIPVTTIAAPDGFASRHATSIAIAPDESALVIGTFDGWVQVYDAKTGEHIVDLVRGAIAETDDWSAVNSVAWSPDGQRIIVTDEDPRVRVFSAVDGKQVASLESNKFNTDDAVFNPAGDRIAVASIDGTIRLWSLLSQ